MQKPISILMDELKQVLIKDINNVRLPSCIIEMILKELYLEANTLAQQQLIRDKENYEASLKKQEEEENVDN